MSFEELGNEPLPWRSTFEVGVEVLDADHRALVRSINEICRVARSPEPREVPFLLKRLHAQAEAHFEREETFLAKIPSELPGHATEHRVRLDQLRALRQRVLDDPEQSATICNELIDWFIRQAIGHDARIKAYFHERVWDW